MHTLLTQSKKRRAKFKIELKPIKLQFSLMEPSTPSKLQYSFAGKRVLVTGGGRGVGRTLVSRLYNEGASVFTLEKNPELLSQLLQDFPDRSKLRAELCDVSNWNQTQALIESFGPIDHLVNCAAIAVTKLLMNYTEDDVDKTMDVNLKSSFCTSQAVAKAMISNGIRGTIVNIASIAGAIACKGYSAYCVSKAGIIMLTKTLALELGQHGIRVNSISPTAINTPMFLESMKERSSSGVLDTNLSAMARQPLQGRTMLEADDMVNSILFLLSPLSSLASGADLVVDGGILAC